jgi:hypothetical protein
MDSQRLRISFGADWSVSTGEATHEHVISNKAIFCKTIMRYIKHISFPNPQSLEDCSQFAPVSAE